MKKKLLILAGDGIGPEVMNEVKKIIVWFNKNKSSDFDITEELAGEFLLISTALQLLTK